MGLEIRRHNKKQNLNNSLPLTIVYGKKIERLLVAGSAN